jgi:drug/metabolite transporter (DMT)-like permease
VCSISSTVGLAKVSRLQRSSEQRISTASLTVLALIAFAGNSVFGRLALGEFTIDPASYTATRLISGTLTLWIIAWFLSDTSSAKSNGGWISGFMLFLYAIAFSVAYISLSAGTGALILFASVQIVMIGVGLYGGERPDALEWLGFSIAVVGLIYLVSPGITAPSPFGSALMAVAGVAWGIYSLRGRGAVDPVRTTSDNFLRAVPFTLAVVFFWSSRLTVSPIGFLWAVLSGSVTSALGYVVWYAALRGLTATRAATVQLAVPVLAALGGAVVLSEAITLRLIISAAVILTGVGLAVARHKTGTNRGESILRAAHRSIED